MKPLRLTLAYLFRSALRSHPVVAMRAAILGTLLGGAALSPAQDVTLDRLQLVGAANLTLDFSDDGSGVIADFAVEATTDLQIWTSVPDATFEDLGGGQWQASVPFDPSTPARFFRVTKNGVPVTGTFSSVTSTIREGETGGVEVSFSGPFSGTINYTVNFGDGTPSQTGSITVQGATSAILPVTVPDDNESDTLRTLTVSLDGGNFVLGSLTTTSVTVEDDDSEWAGVLIGDADDAATQVGLKVTMLEGVKTVNLVTNAGGTFPDTPDGWPATMTVNGSGLSGVVSNITVPASDSLYGAESLLTLHFNPLPGGLVKVADGVVRGYEGNFLLETEIPDLPHLVIPDRTGTFSLFRKPALAPPAPATVPISQ